MSFFSKFRSGHRVGGTVALLSLVLVSAVAVAKKPKTKSTAGVKGGATLHYEPPTDAIDERPVATEIVVTPRGSDYAVRVTFDKVPWGEECKTHCANLTLFVDTDNNPATGLALGKDKPETGADLAITIQGAREYKERSADTLLRAKVRFVPDECTAIEQGETLAEMDHRRDPDRVQSDGKQVFVLVDGTNLSIPSGKVLRMIYHPPAAQPIQATGIGMLAGGAGNPDRAAHRSKTKKRR